MRKFIFIGCLLLLQFAGAADTPTQGGIEWQEWNPSVFERAKAEKKFVLLNLHAVWCHWCHVMDAQTYGDPRVVELIRQKFIAVGVDQDSRPDLANRYEDYGWPATVIFAPAGSELVKQRGFIPPEKLIPLLQAVIDDPTPGPPVIVENKPQYSGAASLPESLRIDLQNALLAGYDRKQGSWGTSQKFLDWPNTEYCLVKAMEGDARFEKMAKQTLAAQIKLLDPAWGGVYQYSDGDWEHPHFEKLIQFQAENLRIYSLAYLFWKERKDLRTAESIDGFVRNFLTSPDGVFYTSQDADLAAGEHAGEYFKLGDAERRKRGIPRVDTHVYGRENGRMINALAQAYAATGREDYLNRALAATKYMIKQRSLPSGGWRHDASNEAGPFLGDSLYMGRALLSLYAVTGNRDYLYRAMDAAKLIMDRCQPPGKDAAGVVTTAFSNANLSEPKPEFDENVDVARFANLLFHYTDEKSCRELAGCAMRYIGTPEIARARHASVGGLLLADLEMNSAPLHIVVVGAKTHPAAKKLFAAAVAYPASYKQVEWQDRAEEPLHKGIVYPDPPQPAAYVCTGNTWSAPILKPGELAPRVDRILNKTKATPVSKSETINR